MGSLGHINAQIGESILYVAASVYNRILNARAN